MGGWAQRGWGAVGELRTERREAGAPRGRDTCASLTLP